VEFNLHRAYFHDLLAESVTVPTLIPHPVSGHLPDREPHGVHMRLAELLSVRYFPSVTERIAPPHAEYEIRNGITELWLPGYGIPATRLGEARGRHTAG
jgi:hypothetical protein